MRMLLLGLIGTMVMAATATAGPLSRFVDHQRVLVISAPAAATAGLRRQDGELRAHLADMSARDLEVVHVVGDQVSDPGSGKLDAVAVRRAVGLSADRFGVALVGQDGSVKLRRTKPVGAVELFSTIDAMPMRQTEMRRSR